MLVLAGGAYAYFTPKTPQTAPETVTEQVKPPEPPTRAELLEATNAERKKAGVAPLVIDERLNQSAQRKADDMLKNDYYSHVNPKTGKRGAEYAQERVQECIVASENLAGYSVGEDGRDVISYLMESTPHKKAILNADYELVGFGIAGDMVTQHFCDID